MSGENAHVAVSIQPDEDTAITLKVFDSFVSIRFGGPGDSVSLMVSDEDTANRLVQAAGEARAKLVGTLTRAKRRAAQADS